MSHQAPDLLVDMTKPANPDGSRPVRRPDGTVAFILRAFEVKNCLEDLGRSEELR